MSIPVFNLTDRHIDYRRKVIPPYGCLNYDLDFIPDRDLALQKAGVLAFNALPPGWARPVVTPPPEKVVQTQLPPPPAPVKAAEVVQSGSSSEQKISSEKDDNRKKK